MTGLRSTAWWRSSPTLDIFEAAALGLTYRITELLAADPTLASAWSDDGFTALHLAAFFGGPVAVKALLGAGADPNAVARNAMEVQPLHSATAAGGTGDVEAARLLLEAGADPAARQQGGFTPMDAAQHAGNTAMIDLLAGYLER